MNGDSILTHSPSNLRNHNKGNIVDTQRQNLEIERNYDAFVRILGSLLPEHRNRFALMRDQNVVALFDGPGAANREGCARYPDEIFSIQEVTDEPIDLGFWSHAAAH